MFVFNNDCILLGSHSLPTLLIRDWSQFLWLLLLSIPWTLDCNSLQDAPDNPPEDFSGTYHLSIDLEYGCQAALEESLLTSSWLEPCFHGTPPAWPAHATEVATPSPLWDLKQDITAYCLTLYSAPFAPHLSSSFHLPLRYTSGEPTCPAGSAILKSVCAQVGSITDLLLLPGSP